MGKCPFKPPKAQACFGTLFVCFDFAAVGSPMGPLNRPHHLQSPGYSSCDGTSSREQLKLTDSKPHSLPSPRTLKCQESQRKLPKISDIKEEEENTK